ncbi:MAG: hypothetical protein DHS20C13_03720 [Thermodesulfobacteriota bacterium]|nr:MAG: hypothetical protein DHS20C13_03720 [Thermodesulfobacteriota bacterium]
MKKLIIFAVIPVLFLSLSSCLLDRSGLAPAPTIRPSSPVGEEGPPGSWSADAFPGYACPADNITLEWNVGDPMCPTGTGPSCQTLTATDTLGLLTPPFTSRDLTGTHVNGSVSSLGTSWSGANPVFTFSVAHDDASDPGWNDATSEVVIVQNPPADPIAVNFKAFSTGCDGALGWRLSQYRLDMTQQDFIDATKGFGDCVRITSVCYLPNEASAKRPNPVIVSLVGGGPMATSTLSLGECVDGFSIGTDVAFDVQPATPVIPTHEGNCIEGDVAGAPVTAPPFTQLLLTFGCDTTLDECGN